MQKLNKILNFIRTEPRWRLIVAGTIILGGSVWWLNSGGKSATDSPTFAARRGPLDITIIEGGSLQALESQEIKCEVRVGYQGVKILKIVDEGYLVTEDDVKNGKVLVELDSSELQNQLVQQEIQYQSAIASLTDAQQNYEIQLGQNESDVKTAEQKTRFARMDFDKNLGDLVTEKIIREVGLDVLLAEATTNNVEETSHAEEVSTEAAPKPAISPLPPHTGAASESKPIVLVASASAAAMPMGKMAAPMPDVSVSTRQPDNQDIVPDHEQKVSAVAIDFSEYANLDALGDGEAKQKLRKFDDDLQVAEKELGQASTALEGTRRLFARGFVPKTEITRDEISFESARLKVQTAETARALFLKYEFPKSAEETLSKYADAVRELDKARRVAISKLAQARAKLNSAKGQYEVQSRRRKDLQEQIEKCTLRAKKSGLVVYGSGRDDGVYYGNQEPIGEGATVRERQAIVTIPDLTRMSVEVKVHESYIKKVKKGQKARITVDAFPDQLLTGEITKVGVLPDSQNRWMNPDLKVYRTTITIDGTHNWVKPGMSAKATILVTHLDDVVFVPVQAIVPEDDEQFCYVRNGFKAERREVETGEFTDAYIEIKKGLKEGERVLLRPPESPATGTDFKEKPPVDSKPPAPAPAGADIGKA